ncbi:MAG: phosphatidylserine decarboxylase [Myxococcota bacterium]
MKPWRHPRFLRLYEHLPHPALDGLAAALMRVTRPRWLVRLAMAAWVRRGGIAMTDFEPGPFDSLERFFLRRLRPGARPIAPGPGPVAPVDGTVVVAQPVAADATLIVKGRPIALAALVGRPLAPAPRRQALTVFLSPDGYHRVHAPLPGVVRSVTPIAGRTFPQNDDALALRPDVYLRNARVVIACDGWSLVMVAASLVSHIAVDVRPGDALAPGQELGHFRFGSTVVLIIDDLAQPLAPRPGEALRMGRSLV